MQNCLKQTFQNQSKPSLNEDENNLPNSLKVSNPYISSYT